MQPLFKTTLALLPMCLGLATLAVVALDPPAAIAQERRADDDDDRGDSSPRRRGGWWSSRRDRSENDRDRGDGRDEPSDRGGEPERQSSDDKSGDSPEITPDSWAKSLVEKHDKNDNKVLDGDEISALTGPARSADFNKDGFISREELVASLPAPEQKPTTKPRTTPAPKTSTDQDDDSKNTAGNGSKSAPASKRVLIWLGAKSGEESKATRRTYRFTPARERLPTELPSWFKSQDKNGDGQVAMSEYSRSWTKSTVAKFQGYDANGDGVVTAKEAAGKK